MFNYIINQIFLIAFLIILLILGIEDIKERKIVIFPLLYFDFLITAYFIYEGYFLSIPYIIITFLEFVWTRLKIERINLGFFYILLIIMPIIEFNEFTYILTFSFILISIFHFLKGFGSGDIKILNSSTFVLMLIQNSFSLFTILPPILIVTLIASATGLIAFPFYKRNYKINPRDDFDKIPYAFHLWIGYLTVIILSSLQLV